MGSAKSLALLKQFFLAILFAFTLAACGGGSSSNNGSSNNSLSTDTVTDVPTSSSPELETEETPPVEPTPPTDSEPPTNPTPPTDPTPGPITTPTGIERDSVRQFTFNHSLWQHTTPNYDNVVTGYWIGEFALASGTTYAWNGQFGQLDYHSLTPGPDLGSDNSSDVFPSSGTNFRDIDIDNVLLMPANFVQGGDTSLGVWLTYTQRVIDWVIDESDSGGQKSGLPIYIYEHWPEAISDDLNESQFQAYRNLTTGSYHQWFLDYQNGLLALYPNVDFRTIPVGPVIADILQNDTLAASRLSFTDLYEDESPHGKPNIYFLAGLVTYQAMYGQKVSGDYRPPVDSFGGVSSELAGEENFTALNDFVWERLSYYNANGVRIWP